MMVGIDYLFRNDFLDADDDMYDDFEKRMYRDLKHDLWYDFSLNDGLIGYEMYRILQLHQYTSSMQVWECLSYIRYRCSMKIEKEKKFFRMLNRYENAK